jgi:hypothetical protein
MKKDLRMKDQEMLTQKLLLEQRLELSDQEIGELREREQSSKRLYDVMMRALDETDRNKTQVNHTAE